MSVSVILALCFLVPLSLSWLLVRLVRLRRDVIYRRRFGLPLALRSAVSLASSRLTDDDLI